MADRVSGSGSPGVAEEMVEAAFESWMSRPDKLLTPQDCRRALVAARGVDPLAAENAANRSAILRYEANIREYRDALEVIASQTVAVPDHEAARQVAREALAAVSRVEGGVVPSVVPVPPEMPANTVEQQPVPERIVEPQPPDCPDS